MLAPTTPAPTTTTSAGFIRGRWAPPRQRHRGRSGLRPRRIGRRGERVRAAAGPVELAHPGPHPLAPGLEGGQDLALVGAPRAAPVDDETSVDVHAIHVLS